MLMVDEQHCTGCGACVQICPMHCISFVQGELGLLMPQIDAVQCVQCGACERVCPIAKPPEQIRQQQFYAAVHKEKQVLAHSTSGGFFTALAQYVLGRGGVVYGCAYEDNFQVRHIRIEHKGALERLRGSKYVQSDTDRTFIQARNDLLAARLVLYSGTPCQIAGLKSFLGRQYENLLTADIVCHGVGSQAFFDKYMTFLKNRENGEIKELHFRRKDFAGWACGGVVVVVALDGKTREERAIKKPFYDYNNYYYHYFLQGSIYRKSCYTCQYANTNRPGDFTMGDFWGVESYRLPIDTISGCSLVIANTEKAQRLIDVLREAMDFVSVTKEQAVKANGQLSHPSKRTATRDKLVKQFATMTGKEMDEAFRKENRKQIAKLHVKALVPYKVKTVLRRKRK